MPMCSSSHSGALSAIPAPSSRWAILASMPALLARAFCAACLACSVSEVVGACLILARAMRALEALAP
jgi:hypothetical protein